jgi:hypothetical protein
MHPTPAPSQDVSPVGLLTLPLAPFHCRTLHLSYQAHDYCMHLTIAQWYKKELTQGCIFLPLSLPLFNHRSKHLGHQITNL